MSGAHRYWRFRVDAIRDAKSGFSICEIDFWRYPWGGSLLAGSGWTISAGAGDAGNAANLTDGDIAQQVLQWRSSTTSANHWIALDLGLGNSAPCSRLVFWRPTNSDTTWDWPTAGRLQYSDDGSTWTDAGSVSGLAWADARAPRSIHSDNPESTPAGFQPVLRWDEPEYWLEADGDLFSDNGTTPIADGQGVYLALNKGTVSGADDFVQTSASERPVWREGGSGGMPYLDMSGAEWFDQVAWDASGGVGSFRAASIHALVENPSRSSGTIALWGSSQATNGGRAGHHLIPGATGAEFRVQKNAFSHGDYTTDTRLFCAYVRSVSTVCYAFDQLRFSAGGTGNFPGTNITLAEPLRNTGLSGTDGVFVGRVYALATLSGNNEVDAYAFDEYLWGKYVVGFSPDPGETVTPVSGPLVITGFAPSLVVDEFISPLPGSLVLTGGVPEIVLDEMITVQSGALEITGATPAVFSGITLEPEPGALVLTGFAPIVTTFQFSAASQLAAVAVAEPDRDAAASQVAVVAIAEIIPPARSSQLAAVAVAEVIPPVASSQLAVVLVASGEPCLTRRAQLWRIRRRDGEVFTFTSHDEPVEFGGEIYDPCNSLNGSAASAQAEIGGVGDMELTGIIAADAIDAADLQAGLFDDAYVEVFWVNWNRDPDTVRRLAAGWTGGVSHGEDGFKAEVLGPGQRLSQKPLTRTFIPSCRWVFGDERCGVDLGGLALVGSVQSAMTRAVFTATVIGDDSGAQYSSGRVVWTSGANAGAVCEVKDYDSATGRIVLWTPAPFQPAAGDAFDLLPGCAQDKETCRDVYDNLINFGGFPDVPGEDSLSEVPRAKY